MLPILLITREEGEKVLSVIMQWINLNGCLKEGSVISNFYSQEMKSHLIQRE